MLAMLAMRSEEFHKSAEGFMENDASERGDFWAGCGRLWIWQELHYGYNQRYWIDPEIID